MDEIREKIARILCAFVEAYYGQDDLLAGEKAIDAILAIPAIAILTEALAFELSGTTPEFQDEIASLLNKIALAGSFEKKVDLAVVDRGAELPEIDSPSDISGSGGSGDLGKMLKEWYNKAQQDMLKAGFVQEVK